MTIGLLAAEGLGHQVLALLIGKPTVGRCHVLMLMAAGAGDHGGVLGGHMAVVAIVTEVGHVIALATIVELVLGMADGEHFCTGGLVTVHREYTWPAGSV